MKMRDWIKSTMKPALFIAAGVVVMISYGDRALCGGASAQKALLRARADISGNGISGEATFTEVESGTQRLVRITLKIKGDPAKLKPGLHGIHLHEKGVCEGDFKSAGGHYDPGPASNPDPDVNHPFHMGDLPNLRINNNGSGTLEAVTMRVTLSDGPLSLFDSDGSAIIIHEKEDQQKSGPSGSGVSGGPRLACGVIKKL
jgi:superoxide dismutase, Cu-Zn family